MIFGPRSMRSGTLPTIRAKMRYTGRHAAFASTFNTKPSIHDYTLTIQRHDTIRCTGRRVPTILTGPTHDYTASAMLPYTLANYVFIGDDTTDAQASETFSDAGGNCRPRARDR